MPEEKSRVGFSLDFKDSKAQIDALVQQLNKLKTGFKNTGKEGESSLNRVSLGLKSVFQGISTMSKNLRKGISDGQKMSRKELKTTLDQATALENRLVKIHSKTSQRFEQAEGRKRSALRATLKAQERAVRDVQRVSEASVEAINRQERAFQVLGAVLTVKISGAFRSLIKDATILAARNEVLGTAMRTVGSNAGISNAELERTEITVRKLGISINDTRELISRFAQAQLGMENASKLARAAQDLAAGSTLGSSEALRIMTQSILSLLPRQLRQFGVVVNLNQVYKEQSRILNKSVNDLTSLEKRQGLLNKIFEEAAKRAGAYERSMEDAGKILTTLSSRIIPDTLSMFGDQLLPVFSALTFAVKDFLEGLQELSPIWKNLITAFAVGLTTILSIKAVLIAIGGSIGFVQAGFAGAVAGATTASAALGPLITIVGVLAAALVVLPAIFGDVATAQEKVVESTRGLVNVEVDRLNQLERLHTILQDQSLTEEELRKIIQNNVKAHKELIPFLEKENVTRKELLGTLDKEIIKSKEVLKISKERAKFAAESQIRILEEQQTQTNSLIVALDKLQAKYGEGKVPVLVLAKALRGFQNEIEGAGGSINAVGGQMREFADENDGGMQNLIRAAQKLGSAIKDLKENVDTEFGTAAKVTVQSSSDMQQAFLGLEKAYSKLAKKALKKTPFAALGKEQEDALKGIEDALRGGLITQERANELKLKNQKLFQDRFGVAEAKFRDKLDSIGATELQKIEIKRRRLVEINQGSATAIESIERQAAADRNTIFEKMWQDKLQVVQQGVEAIQGVVRTERDLAVTELKREANSTLTNERLSVEERFRIRQELRDRSLALLKSSQDEELSVRQQHFKAVALNIQDLFTKGVINEQQFNERAKVLSTDLKNFRQQQVSQRVTFLKNALNVMIAEEVNTAGRLKQLEQDKVAAAKSTQDTIRKLQQQELTDEEVFVDERKRAAELLAEGEIALRQNNFDRVKQINSEIKSIAQATSKEVTETGKKDSEVLISANKARIGSIQLVEQAGLLLQRSFQTQRASEVVAMSKVKDKIDEIKRSLDTLLEEKKEIEIEVIGEAEKQIDAIQSKLDGLEDKTVTVTVQTKRVAAKGGSPVITGSGLESGPPLPSVAPAFAGGAVDIKGPGSSTSDSLLAFLSKGESVMNAAATKVFAPVLELMNKNPSALRGLMPNITAPGLGGGAGNISESTDVGGVQITINGVDSKDVQNINWRKVVKEQIAPEFKRLNVRKPSI